MAGSPAADRTGTDIDAWCSKCKLVLSHIIVAMSGSRVARVECKTCHGNHVYKASAPKPRAPRKASGKSKSSGGTTAAEYHRALEGFDPAQAQHYRVSASFAEGDIINHARFELGLVTRVLADAKIEVMFPLGSKVLVHARPVPG